MKCPFASLWDCSPWNDRPLTMILRNASPLRKVPVDSKWFPPERNYTARVDTGIYCELLVAIRGSRRNFTEQPLSQSRPSLANSRFPSFISRRECNSCETYKRFATHIARRSRPLQEINTIFNVINVVITLRALIRVKRNDIHLRSTSTLLYYYCILYCNCTEVLQRLTFRFIWTFINRFSNCAQIMKCILYYGRRPVRRTCLF